MLLTITARYFIDTTCNVGRKFISLEKRIEATAKNIEGKVQEIVGEVTGNPRDQAEGLAKQAEAQLRHTVENIKDDVKKSLD